MLPESFFCPEHKRIHKKGTQVFRRCLNLVQSGAPRRRRSVRKVVDPDECVCRLKESSPGTVAVRTGSFSKSFHRTMQPFVVKTIIFEKVLQRTGHFVRE
jgi:hypothetical protein